MSSHAPRISVVMPVYNAARFLSEAVESILSQTDQDFEFLIFDDGSTDHSLELLRRYAESDNRVRLFECEHQGHTRLLNRGIDAARGQWIARMDADDVALPDRLMLQAEHLDANPDVAAVGGQVLLIDEDGDAIAPLPVPLAHEQIEAKLLEGRGSALVHPAAMFRKQAVLAVGGYNEEFPGGQDLDLYLRLSERGRLANLPQTVLKFRRHAASFTALAGRQAHQRCEEIVRRAYRRRGVDEGAMRVRRYPQPARKEDLYLAWIDASLHARQLRTSWKYTRRWIAAHPWQRATWTSLARVYGRQALRFAPIRLAARLTGRPIGASQRAGRYTPDTRRLRIAVYCTTFPVVSETFIVEHVAHLLEAGHQVDVLAQVPGEQGAEGGGRRAEGGGRRADVVKRDQLLDRAFFWPRRPRNRLLRVLKGLGLWLAWLPRAPRVMLRALNAVRFGRRALSLDLVYGAAAMLRRPPYDLVHCHFGATGRLAVMLKQVGAFDCPLMVTFHGTDVTKVVHELGGDAPASPYRELFRTVDVCTVGSQFMREQLLKLGAPTEKIHCVPMGIDIDTFPFAARSLPPCPACDVELLTVARLVECKGIETALRAVSLLNERGRPCRYCIVGDGPSRPELERLAEALRISNRVVFLGALPHGEVIRRLMQAHLYVQPSVEDRQGVAEGQGVALLEAQACGLPVVASRIGGIPQGLPPEHQEFLVPPGDAQALASALCGLADQADRWPQIGAAGRRWVEERFDARQLNDRFVQIYRRLAEQAAR